MEPLEHGRYKGQTPSNSYNFGKSKLWCTYQPLKLSELPVVRSQIWACEDISPFSRSQLKVVFVQMSV